MTTSKPLVSVIMPAYNATKFVRQAIDSILQQTYQNWELIIINDASTDDTRKVIAEYNDPRIRVYDNERNLGYLKTCNKLFALCNGDFITFLDADDTCRPNRLERQLAAFEEDQDLGIVGTWVKIVSADQKWLADDQRPVTNEEIQKEIYELNPFCSATVMIRKRVYEEIGGYREHLNGYSYQDYDWTFLIVEKFKAKNIPEYLYEYRQHGASVSKTVSVKRRIGDKIVKKLAQQRKEKGQDYLQTHSETEFDNLILELSSAYVHDKSLLYQETALALIYAGLPKEGLNVVLKAIKAAPLKLRNYKTLKHALLELLRPR